MAAIRGQGNCHAPTKSIRGPRDPPHLHGGHTGPREMATPSGRPYRAKGPAKPLRGQDDRPRLNGGHTSPRGSATTPRQPCRAQETGHAPTAAIRVQENGHAPTAAILGPGDWPRPHGNQYGVQETGHASRRPYGATGPSTPSQHPYEANGTGHASTSIMRGPRERPRLRGGFRAPRNLPRPHTIHTGPTGPATTLRRPYGAQRNGHTPASTI